jgi:sulfatase modifying factor 1
MTEAEILAGLAAHPHEGDGWLILADWLEDHQDPRAALARLRWQYHYEPNHPEFEPRRTRLWTLWNNGMAPLVPTLENSLGMTFALIPPGTFWMGCLDNDPGKREDETRHRVTLTQPFFLSVDPVTVGDFRAFVEAASYQTDAERGDGAEGHHTGTWQKSRSCNWRTPGFPQKSRHPVTCVSWNDAQVMAKWLTKAEQGTGRTYALPTEAQWEFACRAGTTAPYFWGRDENRVGHYAWIANAAENRTHTVDSKRPNPWGLRHMTGMLWEWCFDHYAEYPPEAATDPKGPPRGRQRVQRGGSWFVSPTYCRSAHRAHDGQDDRDTHSGFRLALTVAT